VTTPADIRRYRANLQAEIDGATLYGALATIESTPELAEVYRRLAEAEQRHADIWRDRLRAAGVGDLPASPGWRTRALIRLARRFGSSLVLPTIQAHEQADGSRYASQQEAVQAGMSAEEYSHARLFQEIGRGTPTGLVGGALAQLEGKHRAAGGNALRAAVLGANDGLVSNASLVMGVAGADLAGRSILVTGLAGLLAGSLSMAMGEWLSVQSARELYAHQLAIEQTELEAVPDEEEQELALIYQTKGLAAEPARAIARQLMSDRVTALDTLAREELGIDPQELGGSAWVAAITSFVMFALGAIVPVLPFILAGGTTAVALSALLSILALFGIGAAITIITGRSVLASGLRQVVFGVAAAAITYGIGHLVGAQLAG
jgi:VIT1/CCC1 family predicted Fe2+/Mn2+ transporter